MSAASTAARVTVTVLAALFIAPGWASAGHRGEREAIHTVAGPTFCAGSAVIEKGSDEIGAVALDAAGNLFFDAGVRGRGTVSKVDPKGRTSVLVTGVPRGRASGRSSTSPRVSGLPNGRRFAADGEGGIVLAAGRRLVRVDSANSVTTLAGDARAQPSAMGSKSSGDGGLAREARFISARSVAALPGKGFFISDTADPGTGTFRIRFLNTSPDPVSFHDGRPDEIVVGASNIDTVMGPGGEAKEGKPVLVGGSPALAFHWPFLYVASEQKRGPTVYVLNLSGARASAHGIHIEPGKYERLTESASSTRPAFKATGLRGFRKISALSTDAAGNLYVADEAAHRISRIGSAGGVDIIAGTGKVGFNGNDRAARGARLHGPHDVAVGQDERIYLSDRLNHQLRFIDRAGTIRAAPGNGLAISYQCLGGPNRPLKPPSNPKQEKGEPAVPATPTAVAAASDGAIYFTLAKGNQIKKIDLEGRIVTIAGRPGGRRLCPGALGCAGFRGDGGPANQALLREPTALELTQKGLYVWDGGNARIRFINLSARTVTLHGVTIRPGHIQTVAGNGVPGSKRGSGARSSEIGSTEMPDSMGLRSQQSFGTLRQKLVGPTNQITGPLISPGSLAADRKGNLFIADASNGAVLKVDRSGQIETVTGPQAPESLAGCCRDPVAVETDGAGNLFVADKGVPDSAPGSSLAVSVPSPRIWFINLSPQPITVRGVKVKPLGASFFAGNGGFGFRGDGGYALEAELLLPFDIDADARGNLYLAETGGLAGGAGQIRRIDKSGLLRTIAGTGQEGWNGDGLKASVTNLNFAASIALDKCGNVVMADVGNNRVRRLVAESECTTQPKR
ncbi:MAG: hypothetical protein ACR2FO_00845 [Actinomycetota bacterium]